MNSIESFFAVWDREAQKTFEMFKMLPPDQYDFRPDPPGRSIGELAWHLAEVDAYISLGVATGRFSPSTKPPNIERPRTIEGLAPGCELIHREATEPFKTLTLADLDKEARFFDGTAQPGSAVLWDYIILQSVRHRGQLSVLVRIAGGRIPALFGPTREQSIRAARS